VGLFKPDLYRNFAIGFAIGAAVIGVASGSRWNGDIASSAQAATSNAASQTTGE